LSFLRAFYEIHRQARPWHVFAAGGERPVGEQARNTKRLFTRAMTDAPAEWMIPSFVGLEIQT
jgi:hypothetical protein